MNIYVGNLPYSVRNDELRDAFEQFGNVTSAEVIFDRRTKRSRGYGFVEMDNDEDARRAIDALNGSDFQGRELRVDESKPKGEKRDGGRPQQRTDSRAKGSPAAPPDSGGTGLFGFVKKLFG